MILSDVNVMVYAFRERAADHRRFREWLDAVVVGPEPYGVADSILSSFLRVVTNPSIFDAPAQFEHALEFCEYVRNGVNAKLVMPGSRHWQIFIDLCVRVAATGNLVPDAYIAALAIESDCELVTTDRDFARFPGLRWRHPF